MGLMGTSCVCITHSDSGWPVPDPQSALESCASLEGLHLGPRWVFPVCAWVKGWAKEKAEMGDGIKNPGRNHVGWREV